MMITVAMATVTTTSVVMTTTKKKNTAASVAAHPAVAVRPAALRHPKKKSKKNKERKHQKERRSESLESDRYPVEKSKKKKKKDKKTPSEYASDDERRSVTKLSKHSRGDKEEKSKVLYDPVDMDISEEDDDKQKHKQRSPSPVPPPQSRPRLYSDEELVTSPAQQNQPRLVPYHEETRVIRQSPQNSDKDGRRSKRRFEDMDSFRDRRAAEMMQDKRPRPEDGGYEQKMSSSFNGGMREAERAAGGMAPDKLILIKDKKEEIERAYRQDCETFAAVTKMLVSKDPELDDRLQKCLRDNLKDIGQRCILELKDSIESIRAQGTGSMIV